MIECDIFLEYGSEKEASSIFASIEVDNEGFVDSKLTGKRIELKIKGENPMSVYHTVNDLLSCVRAAESSIL